MKYIFIQIILIGLLASCAGTAYQDKNLVGKWRLVFDRQDCLANMPPNQRKIFEAQPKVQQEVILKEIATQIERDNWIHFKNDHTFEQILLDGEIKYGGKWEIKNGGTQIALQWLKNKDDKNVQRETCQIVLLKSNALVLQSKDKKVKKLSFTPYKI